MSKDTYIDIVFDGPPSPEGPKFVEVENPNGESIQIGEWIEGDDGYWVLRIKKSHFPQEVPEHPVLEKYWPKSGNVKRTKYYPQKEILEVEFNNERVYQYMDVPFNMWEETLDAESIGSFFHRKIKGTYRYVKQ